MKSTAIQLAALALLAATGLFSQQPAQPVAPAAGQVFRVSGDLVQVDAVVTDSKGRQVAALRPVDFEILEDQAPRPVTSLSYVAVSPQSPRTIVFIADNCDTHSGFLNQAGMGALLSYFVDQRMGPRDLVAIMPSAEGASVEQQLTRDKALLHRAIARTDTIHRVQLGLLDRHPAFNGLASLAAISAAIDGLAALPGRKSIVLVSGFLGWREHKQSAALPEFVARANRAGVTVYVLNPGNWTGPTGLGSYERLVEATGGIEFHATYGAERSRGGGRQGIDSRTGLSPLALEWANRTTGFLKAGLDKILDHMSGYYLIGYKPSHADAPAAGPQSQSANAAFHTIAIKVRGRGLTVRSRSGYSRDADAPDAKAADPRGEALQAALGSPLAGGALRVRMTPFYSAADKDPATGLRQVTVQATAAIDPRDLKFEDRPDGSKAAVVAVLAEVFGAGSEATRSAKTCAMTVPAAEFGQIASRTLLCAADLILEHPGSHMLRLAAIDHGSGAVGSAYALVVSPDFNVHDMVATSLALTRAQGQTPAPAGANQVERVFAPGDAIHYACELLGAELDPARKGQNVEARVRVYRTPEAFNFRSETLPVRAVNGPRLPLDGKIVLPPDAAPGHYQISFVAFDAVAHPIAAYQTIVVNGNVTGPAPAHGEMDFYIVKPDQP